MFDPVLLRTFVMVASSRSFTGAAVHLKLGQSTVSQHIQRLEKFVGRRLLMRDTHSVLLTAEGEAMLGYAYAILDANDRAQKFVSGSKLGGKLRFGTSEDFVMSRLPTIMRDFTMRNPMIELQLTVALSGPLFELLDRGELDLVLAKRRLVLNQDREARSGISIGIERLIWFGREGTTIDPERPLPLVVFPRPAITRVAATEALDRAGVEWRVSCTSGSLSGLRAAALAGLGIMVQPRSMIPLGLTEIKDDCHLPLLEEVEFILTGAGKELDPNAAELARQIVNNSSRIGLSSSASGRFDRQML